MKHLTYILLLFMCSLSAQDNVSIALYQDAKLGLIGDDIGNEAFTTNLIARFNLNGRQDSIGFGFMFPEFELANLKGGEYYRYSFNGGYTFNQVIKNLEASLTGGLGLIHRNGLAYRSYGFSGVLGYKIGRFKPVLMLQGVDRVDINEFVFSGFLGIEYNFK